MTTSADHIEAAQAAIKRSGETPLAEGLGPISYALDAIAHALIAIAERMPFGT